MSGASFPSSYIKTTDSAVSRAADDLSFPISFGPQSMTSYVKIVESGTAVDSSVKRLLTIGEGNSSEKPKAVIRQASGDGYQGFYQTSSATSITTTNPSSVPSIGDTVELVLQIHSDGHVELVQSINGGGTDTYTDSTTADFPASWAQSEIQLNKKAEDYSGNGFTAIISGPIIAPGVRTMNECRALAGTA